MIQKMSRLLTRLPNRARLLPVVPRRIMATELGTSKSPQNGQKGFVSIGSQTQGDSPSNQAPTEVCLFPVSTSGRYLPSSTPFCRRFEKSSYVLAALLLLTIMGMVCADVEILCKTSPARSFRRKARASRMA
ncbi:unnamed protein product [Sordaria macrospora k-hell]|uniref:WGS project CABT00000000 data, contig 2.5 n=1 Tax=Sordaria macrospora (strain ATCC MYA-333 / DSM 997 / K(L3346) / K-hell) TaxID=771870 RepID=F7VRZ8_SORMK|nr:uncharacterized protein SMAC_01832 [Sordaria macrospora k-hell]CCC08284.1 unnamed protein product [Sordaria macrospora k-hell]